MHGVELDFDGAVLTVEYDAADTDVAAIEARLRDAGYGTSGATPLRP